jgi:glyoxylase-like metal-dependent hydrolase (beta-lactamase superfamily II)
MYELYGCKSFRKAVIIDPTCEVDNNATSAIVNNNDLRITAVIDTHMHADHLSGALGSALGRMRSAVNPCACLLFAEKD